MSDEDLEGVAIAIEKALSTDEEPDLTERAAFVKFVEPLATTTDREVVAVIAAVWIAVGNSLWHPRPPLFRLARQVGTQLSTRLLPSADRWQRAAEVAVWYLLGGSGRPINRSSQGLDGIPEKVCEAVTGYLKKLVVQWLLRLLKLVIGFREQLTALARPIDEAEGWSGELYQILTGVVNGCRCWVPEGQRGRNPHAYVHAHSASNAGRKYAACRQWHHISFWDPAGPLRLWQFLSKGVTGGPDPANVGKKSLPSGLLWHCWNKAAVKERDSLLLRVAKVARRQCPTCDKWSAGGRCWHDDGHPEDLTGPVIRVRVEEDYLILDRCFEAKAVWVCTNDKCRAAYLVKPACSPADSAPKGTCRLCGQEIPDEQTKNSEIGCKKAPCRFCGSKISSKESEVYYLRRRNQVNFIRLPALVIPLPNAPTRPASVERKRQTDLQEKVKGHFPADGWEGYVIDVRFMADKNVLDRPEVQEGLKRFPDRPTTPEELELWFQTKVKGVARKILGIPDDSQ
jgi:hypothetical protein